jgi:hypothetical protein
MSKVLPDIARIYLLPIQDFVSIITVVDQKIGDLLRQISAAVEEPVKALFRGTLDPLKEYGVERIQRSAWSFIQVEQGSYSNR